MIKKDIINLAPFKESIRDKFKLIDDIYKMLVIYYENNPIRHESYLVKSRHQIGYEFYKLFSLTPLSDDEINYALNAVYTSIGIENVVMTIANFAGLVIKIDEKDVSSKKLTISIVSQNIFDLNLFESKLTEFLKDVLLFQNLEFLFELIVLRIPLNYSKKLYNIVEIQNTIYINNDEFEELDII